MSRRATGLTTIGRVRPIVRGEDHGALAQAAGMLVRGCSVWPLLKPAGRNTPVQLAVGTLSDASIEKREGSGKRTGTTRTKL